MKTLKIIAATGLMLASAASFAQANNTPYPYTPGAGIKGTPHDWSRTDGTTLLQWQDSSGYITTYNTGTPNIDSATGKQTTVKVTIGLCTKCHTPHQAKSTNLLWNHTLLSTEYQWDVPATTAGTLYPKFKGDTYKGASTKCLSCHDGQLASTDGMWFNRQSVTGSKYVAGAGSLNSGHEVATHSDMSGSHPVAFPYPYMGSASTYNGTFTGDAAALDEFVADPTASLSAGIRLFNDDGSGNIVAGPASGRAGMECTSCHDVHNGKRTKDIRLLTGEMTGSTQADGYLCLQCHIK